MIRRIAPALIVALLALSACGGDEKCGGGAKPGLAVWAERSGLAAAFTLEHGRPATAWDLTLVHEGKVAWRGSARTDATGTLKVVRRFGNDPGADHVGVRAIAPDGATCAASVAFADAK